MTDSSEERIGDVDFGSDGREEIKVKDQHKKIMSSIVTVGESALSRRFVDMRKEVEMSQMQLEKSVKLVEEIMRELKGLKEDVVPDKEQLLPATSSDHLLSVGQTVYAMSSTSLLSPWQQATLLSVQPDQCLVQFPSLPQSVLLPLTQIAYSFPTVTALPVGSRCIALYKEDSEGGFYPGLVGEMANSSNSGRYLVFYDDGYASYVSPGDLMQVCKASKKVWQDVDQGNRDFIKMFVTEYPVKKMVKLVVGDKIMTELYGDWILAEVTEVDESLAEITFEAQEACEWIYRGSKRFQPIYKLLQMKTSALNVFKPSNGHIVQQTVPVLQSKPYQLHECSPSCLAQHPYQPSQHKTTSPLTIPLHLGWRREVTTHWDPEVQGNWTVFYISPCGRRLRNIKEVHSLLNLCNSNLTVDLFVFDCWVHVLDVFQATQDLLDMPDISHGAERMPIPACNPYSCSPPPYMEYSTAADPQPGVQANADTGFLLGCGCTDDCQDKTSCSCWQLTIQATSCDREGWVNTQAGYRYRRLPDVVLTGIYECNQTCACRTTCLNRVVQLPLRARLQVFKTEAKGWGVRSLVDLPQGAFVCTYVGRLYGSEQEAGFEDAYFADLDLIEVVERRKEGYESDVSDIEEFREEDLVIDDASVDNNNRDTTEMKPQFISTRQLFGPDQEIFIMDAMTQGNIGRYFNHSCNPNTFVQNVFVSRHDLRFPTLAFFTMKYVPAGTELCWDYSYKVGALPGKQIDCHCGEENCRKRLL
eukprot:GFUD01004846.1.p1 GENE.GFUD01004846.1~~GFUD01004846.1.p1  ORF type:complete len:756 (+),score=216.68 GFUD01004846.1:52-2319(+)